VGTRGVAGWIALVLSACRANVGSSADASGHDGAACVPVCAERVCGDDSCGGSCGTCDIALGCSPAGQCIERTDLDWAGIHWSIRGGTGNPGPNTWDRRNVWVDTAGNLHLQLVQRDGIWTGAELWSSTSFGFGRFQWWVEGRIDLFDVNVVLGLFTYPTPQVGPDRTNEIDVEVARWGNPNDRPLNFTVWPAATGISPNSLSSPMSLNGTYTTHRFDWASDHIAFASLHGFRDDDLNPIATWNFMPADPVHLVPQQPVPLHLNLWLFQGHPPSDGSEVEIIVHAFSYQPL
jgi:hypothetical protein